ncbi:DNA-binding protein (plasmid) [Burkholderia aenigmatica]|uniref:DNA-binding protein n=1 Tax=Burkholderia aenigmatica TaxID=2015348 RepID=UPI003B43CEA4
MANLQVTKAAVLKVLGESQMTANHVAVVLDAKQSKVNSILDTLLYSGHLELIQKADGNHQYRRKTRDVAESVEREPLTTSIAGRQIAPNLRSTLTGYDREISRRVSLCMAGRGR